MTKSEEPPLVPPPEADENASEDNVDEHGDNESDEEEESIGDFDEEGKMNKNSLESHD